MSTGRAAPGQPLVSASASGEDWAAWLRSISPALTAGAPRDGPAGTVLSAAWDALVYLARRQGFAVDRRSGVAPDGSASWRARRIAVSDDGTPEHALTALAHQLGHVLLHGKTARLEPGGMITCRGARKVEADSVGYLVTAHLGIPTPAVTFPPVASWAGTDPRAQPGQAIELVSRRTVAAAALITRHLDGALRPGADLQAPAPAAAADLADVLQAAAEFFHRQLSSAWVAGYLASRGFGPGVQQRWMAGYAPRGWDALVRHLRGKGYPVQLIEAAGLARRSSRGTLIDIFRDRAVLPVRSPDGTIVGFIGRARPGSTSPKYLNSPRTAAYDKGSVLFGLAEARGALARGARPVLVEGPFDAIAVTTAGGGRYVGLAPCGTALTSRQLAALAAVTGLRQAGISVAFDADQAGRRAAVRAYYLLAPLTGDIGLVRFPDGQDAAQLLQLRGPAALASALSHAQPLADLVIDAEVARYRRWLAYPEGQIRALRAAAPLVAAMPPAGAARQVSRLTELLALPHATVTEAVTDALPGVIAAGQIPHSCGGSAGPAPGDPGPAKAARTAGQDLPAGRRPATGPPAANPARRGSSAGVADPPLRGRGATR